MISSLQCQDPLKKLHCQWQVSLHIFNSIESWAYTVWSSFMEVRWGFILLLKDTIQKQKSESLYSRENNYNLLQKTVLFVVWNRCHVIYIGLKVTVWQKLAPCSSFLWLHVLGLQKYASLSAYHRVHYEEPLSCRPCQDILLTLLLQACQKKMSFFIHQSDLHELFSFYLLLFLFLSFFWRKSLTV